MNLVFLKPRYRLTDVSDIQRPADIRCNKPWLAIACHYANLTKVPVGKNLNVVHEELLSDGAEGVATLRLGWLYCSGWVTSPVSGSMISPVTVSAS